MQTGQQGLLFIYNGDIDKFLVFQNFVAAGCVYCRSCKYNVQKGLF